VFGRVTFLTLCAVLPGMVELLEVSREVLEQLPRGAFLTVRGRNGGVNTMTIGWGTVGTVWRRPTFVVLVRPDRYTHSLMEGAEDFTVSVPLKGQLKKELQLCGTTSGKVIDKFKEHGLEEAGPKVVSSPGIAGCDVHIECRIMYKQSMSDGKVLDPLVEEWYEDEGRHTIYFGEIVSCWSD